MTRIVKTIVAVEYSPIELLALKELSFADQARLIYNKLNPTAPLSAQEAEKGQERAIGEYFRSACSQMLVSIDNEALDRAWDDAKSRGMGEAWAKKNGYVTNYDIPALMAPRLTKNIDQKKFKSMWSGSMPGVCLVDPLNEFCDSDKNWLQHLTALVNSTSLFQTKGDSK